MLIYRDTQGPSVAAVDLLRRCESAARRLAAHGSPACDAAMELAIDLGMLEAAIEDARDAGVDDLPREGTSLRRVVLDGAAASLAATRGSSEGQRRAARRAADGLACLSAASLPERITLRTPEGFAYYGLFPETYAEAARRLVEAERPSRVACVGIRSIGTTLSAFVGAAVEACGIPVVTATVRPGGHPFDRRVRLAPRLARLLSQPPPDLMLIVDEGPGLSGSSFAAAAEAVTELGMPAERVVLMPAWNPDGSAFVSERAAAVWRRHRRVVGSFEDVWLESGRLAAAFDAQALRDLSSGLWQGVWTPREPPAIQPQHERRKFLASARRAERGGERATLLKFAGLGRFGANLLARAHRLEGTAAARPLTVAFGFFEQPVIDGRPLSRRDVSPEFLEGAAQYIGDVADRCGTGEIADREPLAAMLETNAREAFPEGRLPGLSRLLASARDLTPAQAVRLDARMLPHEWLRAPGGFVKTDALEHHDDHFFPGPQDVAWDVAGTVVEFGLDEGQAAAFTERAGQRLGDRTLARRMDLYRAAYLAFRVGYCTLGAQALGGSNEGQRLAAAAGRYKELLRRRIE